ncbi:MAG: T9SS type A sorting domain-containing protein [Crocinitomix sp.]|nr:T9SS type A sorting domain-containing protein [Crocinitomix sp.]
MKKKLLLFTVAALSTAAVNAQYCTGGPGSTGDTNLQAVDLVGESSSISYVGCSPAVTGLELKLDEVADLTIGADYTIDLSWGSCGGNYNNGGNVWIDFDHSDTFDADEIIATKAYNNIPTIMSPTFTVPADAVEGPTRMRVMQHEGGSPPLNPCASMTWGSKVDFTIDLLPACEDIIVDVTDYETCEGEMVTITGTGLGAITWTGGITNGVAFDPGVPGVYTYLPSSDDEGDCPFAEEDAISIQVYGPPVVIAGAGDLNFCEDEMITLSAAGGADVYEWNDGEELDLMPGVGTYTFTLTGESTTGGCVGTETTDEVTVEVHALPTITGSADADPICIGGSVVFSGAGGETYEWDNGVMDGMAFTPESIGTTTYTVWGWDEFGCANMGTVDVEVVDNITISVASVTIETVGADGEIDIEISGGAPTYSYDWDNDGTGDWDDTQDLTGLSGGIYTVMVEGAAGCQAQRTIDLNSQVGIDDLNASNVAVYPNPTTEFVNIEFAGTFEYQLVAINGDILVAGNATDKEVINLKEFADGVYFVNVKNENATTTIKVVKK